MFQRLQGVSGQIFDANGQSIKNATVIVFSSISPEKRIKTKTIRNGFYHVPLLPGKYGVLVKALGHEQSDEQQFEVGSLGVLKIARIVEFRRMW